jgi:hypothetical protein
MAMNSTTNRPVSADAMDDRKEPARPPSVDSCFTSCFCRLPLVGALPEAGDGDAALTLSPAVESCAAEPAAAVPAAAESVAAEPLAWPAPAEPGPPGAAAPASGAGGGTVIPAACRRRSRPSIAFGSCSRSDDACSRSVGASSAPAPPSAASSNSTMPPADTPRGIR